MDNEVPTETTVSPALAAAKKRGRPVKKPKFTAPVQVTPVVAEETAVSDFSLEIGDTAMPETPFRVDTPPTERPVMRPELRTAPREEDPRTRAARRAAELRDHGGVGGEGTDEFYIDPAEIPDGWEYEWKRRTVLGQEDPAYQVAVARAGWEPVPASRHPSFMPLNSKQVTIERKGMILMERPKEISDEARQAEIRKARMQVRQKEQQLNSAPDGQFGRQKSDGTGLVKVSKSYEPIPIPKD
jgi:hypothetical protein